MLNSARSIVRDRRHWPSFGGTATRAAKVFLERARATDDAVDRLRQTTHWQEATFADEEAAERAAGDAWEKLYLAALDLDSACPAAERTADDLVRVMAGLHNSTEGSWQPYLSPSDGSRGYTDRHGRTTAVLTAWGRVEPGPWFKQGMTLPSPPR